jgi:hypothetical protein
MKQILLWLTISILCILISGGVTELVAIYIDVFLSPVNAKRLIETLTFLFSLQFTLILGVSFQWFMERHEIVQKFSTTVRDLIEANLSQALEKSTLSFFIREKNGSEVSRVFSRVAQNILERLRERSPTILDAASILFESQVSLSLKHLDDLLSAGTPVDILDHLKTTRYLCTKYTSYLQIQRRAFFAPDEWTKEWCGFVDGLAKSPISKKYVVVLPANEIETDAAKLRSMEKYLSSRGFQFGVCDLKEIADSIAGTIPTEAVVEVFGGDLFKLAELPHGKYQGGIHLRVCMFEGHRRPDILSFARSVEACLQ